MASATAKHGRNSAEHQYLVLNILLWFWPHLYGVCSVRSDASEWYWH